MNYDYSYTLANAAVGGTLLVYYLVMLAVWVLMIIGRWKVFTKAGKPGWGSLIPFYSSYCLYDIAFGTGWLFLLTLVPCVGFVFSIILQFKLAKSFGLGAAFGFGLLFLNAIFMMILGFGNYTYYGPDGEIPQNPTNGPENPYYN